MLITLRGLKLPEKKLVFERSIKLQIVACLLEYATWPCIVSN